jgi:hypothetical protein
MSTSREWLLLAVLLTAPTAAASANVITDWDERAVAFLSPKMNPAAHERELAMMHVAIFDAVNSIEPRYKPYLVRLPAPAGTSVEAAVAAAASTVLAKLHPEAASEFQAALASSLAAIPDGEAKSNGVKLGEMAAAKCLEARANDGSSAPDDYRPKAKPGVYVPTPLTANPQWPHVTPFAMTKPSQFRPKPPISLKSEEWAKDYNEIRDYGGKTSTKRSARQTEDGRFWLLVGAPTYHPLARQIVIRKEMSLVDSARFMALISIAAEDAYIAVFDAKYKYEFWRPITAIRNGDIDDNPATEREATWQPLDNTPMHPEYPCAHCITSAAVATIIETVLGTANVPELTLTSATAPGVTHRWTNVRAYTDEVSAARIWAGFHYRFSTVVGQDMGRKVAAYVVKNVMQPVK